MNQEGRGAVSLEYYLARVEFQVCECQFRIRVFVCFVNVCSVLLLSLLAVVVVVFLCSWVVVVVFVVVVMGFCGGCLLWLPQVKRESQGVASGFKNFSKEKRCIR